MNEKSDKKFDKITGISQPKLFYPPKPLGFLIIPGLMSNIGIKLEVHVKLNWFRKLMLSLFLGIKYEENK